MIAEWVVQVAEIFNHLGVGIAAILTGIAALVALNTWHNELKGKAQYELSRRLYLLAHQYAAEFEHTQTTTLNYSESVSRKKYEDETPDVVLVRDLEYAHWRRVESLEPRLKETRDLAQEAQLVLGISAREIMLPFDRADNLYRAAISAVHAQMLTMVKNPNAQLLDKVHFDSLNGMVHGVPGNEVSVALTSGLDHLEKTLRPFMR